MKKLIGLLFLPVFCISQTGEGFLIKGNIKGLKDSTVITLLSGNDKTIIASGMVNKDVFTIMGKLKDPTILQLSFYLGQRAVLNDCCKLNHLNKQ